MFYWSNVLFRGKSLIRREFRGILGGAVSSRVSWVVTPRIVVVIYQRQGEDGGSMDI
jgi:hypothetical protein